MSGITIGEISRSLLLENLTPESDLEGIMIESAEINRPGLQLSGFFAHFDGHRVQLIGNVEMAYIRQMTPEAEEWSFDRLFRHKIPCLIMTRGHKPDEIMLRTAAKHGTPILSTLVGTSDISARILRYAEARLAPLMASHGVLVDVFGEGVLILGESGIGKSEAALELLKRGHRLVADDSVELRRVGDDMLSGSAPAVTRHLMELRGIGVIDVKTLFGVERVKDEMTVSMAVQLEEWDKTKTYDRLGTTEEYVEYLGVKLLCYRVPVSPGRNLAVILETAAMNYRQKMMGYDAVKELERRFREKMQQSRMNL